MAAPGTFGRLSAVGLGPLLPGRQRCFEQRPQARLLQVRGRPQLYVTMNLATALHERLRIGQFGTTRDSELDACAAHEQCADKPFVSGAITIAEELCGF